MNAWEEKVRQKLIATSVNDADFNQLRKEWRFTGNYKDHGKAKASCELCGNTGLRHHYLIANKQTGEALWVGSQCILNFDESIYGEVKKVRRTKQKEFQKQIDGDLLDKIMPPIVALYDRLPRDRQRNLHWVVGKFRRRSGFSPADLTKVFNALEREEIKYPKESFPVIIRSKQDKIEMLGLRKNDLQSIWVCLTEEQRKNILKA